MALPDMVEIPIVCENPVCPRFGEEINRVTGVSASEIDLFFEDYDSSDEADICPACGSPGVAYDPELTVSR